jgi:hypothetical protein
LKEDIDINKILSRKVNWLIKVKDNFNTATIAIIKAKGEPFPAESLIMALLLSQHKMID